MGEDTKPPLEIDVRLLGMKVEQLLVFDIICTFVALCGSRDFEDMVIIGVTRDRNISKAKT